MTRVYAPGAAGPSVTLSADEGHHAIRVLRLRVGATVIVFDGEGREWTGRIASTTRDETLVDLVDARVPIAEPPVRVTLAIALLKGDQMDDVIRDAVALGVAAIQPMETAHVALPERARRARSTERWMRVAVAAAKQCARATVPAIEAARSFDDVLKASGDTDRIMCVEPDKGGGHEPRRLARPGAAVVFVGPEGGWSDAEIERARRAGTTFLDLGPRTLRAEIAPAVALSALWSAWGWR